MRKHSKILAFIMVASLLTLSSGCGKNDNTAKDKANAGSGTKPQTETANTVKDAENGGKVMDLSGVPAVVNESTIDDQTGIKYVGISESVKGSYDINMRIPKPVNTGNPALEAKVFAEIRANFNAIKDDVVGMKTDSESSGYASNGSDSFPYEGMGDVLSALVNKKYISIATSVYTFTGGAHGSTGISSYNYKVSSGEILTLKDVFGENQIQNLKAVNDEISRQIKVKQIDVFPEAEASIGIDARNFYITDKSLVVYFNQYEIAPYASGVIYIEIPLDKIGFN
jgi:hypothetical protein